MRNVLSLAAVLAFGLGSVSTLAYAQDTQQEKQQEKQATKAVSYKAVVDGMT
jgi:hypothetical protein